jgi:23S rRNA (uracil1939-C5)-methyltransferase
MTITSKQLPVSIGQTYLAEVIGLSHEGNGVARVNGFTLFIRGALPGEKVKVKVSKLKKQYGYGDLLEIIESSPARVQPACPVYEACGGCQLQHLDYSAQLEAKRQQVVDSFTRIGKLTDVIVHPTIGMHEPWRYRNKTHVPVAQDNGRLISGFYAAGSHQIVQIEHCLIGHERGDAVVALVKRIAEELGIRAYDAATGRGLLRHVITRVGFHTGELMVVLVVNGELLPKQDEFIGLLRLELPDLTSLCLNINTDPSSVVMGNRTVVLWGSDTILDTIGDITFAISARSFYQVNPVQTERLYAKAVEYARLTGVETVIDAYCGIGTISLFLAQHADHVYGVEIVPDAIEDAKRNARLNEMRNVTFEAGKAEVVIPRWRERGITAEVIVVDPPRKGCDQQLLDTIIAMRPSRVVYVSCNPATLARDLRILEDGGYRTVEAQPVDMFPHTSHVECCVSLVRK